MEKDKQIDNLRKRIPKHHCKIRKQEKLVSTKQRKEGNEMQKHGCLRFLMTNNLPSEKITRR